MAHFNDMLCAHERVFDLVMPNLVDVRLVKAERGRAFVCFHNRGPIALTAEITETPIGSIVLGPYQQVLIGMRRVPSDVVIRWRNLYIRPTENLVTTHLLN
jgi:hypothetical protein